MKNLILAAACFIMSASLAFAQANPADQAYAASMSHMDQTMSAAPMTGNADADFAAMMKPHHQGAIEMAQAELKFGHDPQLRKMAAGIITAQTREIAAFNAWEKTHPVTK